jgi:3-deoxy-D-manno-octulosonic-acid transferase
MTLFFYNLLMYLFSFVLRIYGVFNTKIALWNKQRNIDHHRLSEIKNKAGLKPIVWMHCASLGEYEQGIELIKSIQQKHPSKYYYLLSFFSPSGYQSGRVRSHVDEVIYLNIDTKNNATKIFNIIKPKYFLGVKYEFWWNHISAALKTGVEVIYVSVSLKSNHYLFRSWSYPFINILKKISQIYTQDKVTTTLLDQHSIKSTVAGDTRIIGIIERLKTIQSLASISSKNKTNLPVIVYGSIYQSDLDALIDTMNDKNYFHIIVPHNIEYKNVLSIERKLTIQTTKIDDEVNNHEVNGVIINKIGLLFDIYQYADYVYIGGGFEKNIHNTLEPAIFGVPLSFGPNHKNFNEANYFIDHQIASLINDKTDFQKFIEVHQDQGLRKEIKEKSQQYFEANSKSIISIMKSFS